MKIKRKAEKKRKQEFVEGNKKGRKNINMERSQAK